MNHIFERERSWEWEGDSVLQIFGTWAISTGTPAPIATKEVRKGGSMRKEGGKTGPTLLKKGKTRDGKRGKESVGLPEKGSPQKTTKTKKNNTKPTQNKGGNHNKKQQSPQQKTHKKPTSPTVPEEKSHPPDGVVMTATCFRPHGNEGTAEGY